MAIPWDLVYQFLLEWLESCDETAEKKLRIIRSRNMGDRLLVRRAVNVAMRKSGIDLRDRDDARIEILEEIREASEVQLAAFIGGGIGAVDRLDSGKSLATAT